MDSDNDCYLSRYKDINYLWVFKGTFMMFVGGDNHDEMVFYFKTGGVSHCGLIIYIKKVSKAKEELWKFKYFTMTKYRLQKNSLKETKIFTL